MSALSELLQGANKESLSMQKITDRARTRGHDIGKDTIWKYMTGRHGKTVQREHLEALADVFPGVTLQSLEEAAKLPPDLGDYTPPPEARALSRDERDAVTTIIKSMARGKVQTGPRQATRQLRQQEAERFIADELQLAARRADALKSREAVAQEASGEANQDPGGDR